MQPLNFRAYLKYTRKTLCHLETGVQYATTSPAYLKYTRKTLCHLETGVQYATTFREWHMSGNDFIKVHQHKRICMYVCILQKEYR